LNIKIIPNNIATNKLKDLITLPALSRYTIKIDTTANIELKTASANIYSVKNSNKCP
jgi:hypothetical protein